ncbi:MAG: citrate synthase [Selenomonadaceae bacterium]|nr:citrate synthase [Selenomonadaceae bacterium]
MAETLGTYAQNHVDLLKKSDYIDPALYEDYGVKVGLRDAGGKGVLTGLTNISQIVATKFIDGKKKPCDGELWYRSHEINELVNGLGDNLGFEKIAYLLIMGVMPNDDELAEFKTILGEARKLPPHFVRDIIMKAPTGDIMKSMMRSILAYSYYDTNALDTSVGNVLRQCIELISTFPLFAAYAYHSYNHYKKGGSMYIHMPDPKLSAAENLLSILRPDRQYTPLEAKVLDTALILHMERGGANLKFISMMGDIREHVNDCDRDEVAAYVEKIVNKEAFDRTGLIYGMGHAVYTLSDPRERILKEYVKLLVREKGMEDYFALHENIEAVAPAIIAKARNMPRPPAPNVDFYSVRFITCSTCAKLFVPLTRASWLNPTNERLQPTKSRPVSDCRRARIFVQNVARPDTVHARRNCRDVCRQNFYRPEGELVCRVAQLYA